MLGAGTLEGKSLISQSLPFYPVNLINAFLLVFLDFFFVLIGVSLKHACSENL